MREAGCEDKAGTPEPFWHKQLGPTFLECNLAICIENFKNIHNFYLHFYSQKIYKYANIYLQICYCIVMFKNKKLETT